MVNEPFGRESFVRGKFQYCSSKMKHFIILSLAVLAVVAAEQAHKIQPRIVGGQQAASGQFPFYGFVNIRFPAKGKGTACGSSLINDEWILTAAHCLEDAARVIVSLGEYDLTIPEPENIDITINIDDLHPHPEYDPKLNLHDIGKCMNSSFHKCNK